MSRFSALRASNRTGSLSRKSRRGQSLSWTDPSRPTRALTSAIVETLEARTLLSAVQDFTVFDLGVQTAAPGAENVLMLGFQFQVVGSNAAFDKVELQWRGTGPDPTSSISQLALYVRAFDVVPTAGFDHTQATLVPVQTGQGKDLPKAGDNKMELQVDSNQLPNKLALPAGKWYQIYVVADIKSTATEGHTVDFRVQAAQKVIFSPDISRFSMRRYSATALPLVM
jgi:hypothetical protein